MKTRFIYLGVCGILLAGIIHITIILLIPLLGERDAAKQIAKTLTTEKFHFIGDGSKVGISNIDPYMKLSICRFDLEKNAIEIKGPQIPTFWSASVFNERGRVIYSLNDRTAIKNQLQMVIVNPIQMADIRQSQPEEIETSILVESQSSKGFVLLRALISDESWQPQVLNFLEEAHCKAYEINTFEEG